MHALWGKLARSAMVVMSCQIRVGGGAIRMPRCMLSLFERANQEHRRCPPDLCRAQAKPCGSSAMADLLRKISR